MLDTKEILEKKFNKDTHRIIAESQLQRYSSFFEKFSEDVQTFSRKLKHPLCSVAKPITVNIIPSEDISLLKLVSSDNKLLSRILVSLSSVCNETHLLVAEAKDKFFTDLVYYGEFDDEEKGLENLPQMEKLFELLQKIQLFVKRSQDVIVLLLQQLCAIIGRKFNSDSSVTSFPEMLECLAELLVCLMTLDSLLHVPVIQEHWKVYKRAVRTMLHNSQHFQINVDDVRQLDKKILDLEDALLTGMIMKRTMDKCLGLDEQLLIMIKSCNLSNEIMLFIQQLLQSLEADDESVTYIQTWLQVNAMFVLHVCLNGAYDKKVLKRILDANKKVAACVLSGNIVWLPEQFLVNHIPALSKVIDSKAAHAAKAAQITQRTQNLHRDTNAICMQACLWFVLIEKKLKQDASKFKVKDLQDCSALLVDGIKLLKKMSESVRWITNLHAEEGRPMPKSVLLNLCKLVEILVSFQFVFRRNILPLSYVLPLISQQLTHKALALISNMKKSFVAEKTYKEQQLDVLSALVVAEKALKGPNTRERLLVTKLSLSASGLHSDTLIEVRQVVQKLEFVCNLLPILSTLTNCSFLYWHQVLFPVYFNKLATSRADLTRSYLLLAALSHSTTLAANTRDNAERYVDRSLVEPLRECIEANLRHQTHLHLQLNPLNPFQTPLPASCKKLQPVLFADTYINMRHDIEHYLSTMFYNLTTVVLHDWRTYGEMRRLAVLQYGLKTVEDNLPVQTLEQGLDVLEIMRNINVFVAKYMYNLNNQVFVEESSSNKHLNTINISHVANSIRTHGIGIMSTTVNFTYQFLQNKFYTFSQFMYDEQIKSRLLKDLRYFTEHKGELNQMYPYARADAFNHGIRKLGLNEHGLTYLDLFRKLITQIGNAMGYVRLIRSGGKRCVADGTCFLPDLKSVDALNDAIDDADLPELTKQAAQYLRREINNLADNFEEATEYFKLLINAFAAAFRDPQNLHLRNFYVIIPPLTINYVEHLLNCKERLNKNNRDGSAFTDDGFAMGIAYIVELLDQGSQLNSLHWFQSVWTKQLQERKLLEAQKAKASKEDNKLQQALSLTEKRIKSIEMEFKLLYYSFSSARIFFEK